MYSLSYHVYSESFYVLLFSIISEFICFYQGVLCAFYSVRLDIFIVLGELMVKH